MFKGLFRHVFLFGKEVMDNRKKLIQLFCLQRRSDEKSFEKEVNVVTYLIDQDIG